MRKDNSQRHDQLLSPFTSQVSLWNHLHQDPYIQDATTQMHTPQQSIKCNINQTNLFTQKFKDSYKESYASSIDGECHFCPYHPQKKAKYRFIREDGSIEKICSKCAIVYAQKGCKNFEEIPIDDVRKQQTDSFIQQLVNNRAQIEDLKKELVVAEGNIKQFYEVQYNQVVKTFADVEQALQICKQKVFQKLTCSMWNGLQLANQMQVEAKQIENQIQCYIEDIKIKYDDIVHHMGRLPFNQLMGSYGSELFKLIQKMKQIDTKSIVYLHFEGKETCLKAFIQELSRFTERNNPESPFQSHKKEEKRQSTRSSSEQKSKKQKEQDKRHQSQPNKNNNNNNTKQHQETMLDSSGQKTHTFKITEESIEEWIENSSSKQRENTTIRTSKNVLNSTINKNLQTEPSEAIHQSPNLMATKFLKKEIKPQRTSLKQDSNSALMAKLLEGFNQIKRDREQRPNKKISKTPELGKSQQAQQFQPSTKITPKFLYKNYYK